MAFRHCFYAPVLAVASFTCAIASAGQRVSCTGSICFSSGVQMAIACAPEVAEGNVRATERTLGEIARRPDFLNATTFRARVAEARALRTPAEKISAYLRFADVREEDVAEFMGAREPRPSDILHAQRSLGLSDRQASVVVAELQAALRGSLR